MTIIILVGAAFHSGYSPHCSSTKIRVVDIDSAVVNTMTLKIIICDQCALLHHLRINNIGIDSLASGLWILIVTLEWQGLLTDSCQAL